MKNKTIITPLQKWLLGQGKCSGCGRSLEEGEREAEEGATLVTCSCKRAFLYQPESGSYKRVVWNQEWNFGREI